MSLACRIGLKAVKHAVGRVIDLVQVPGDGSLLSRRELTALLQKRRQLFALARLGSRVTSNPNFTAIVISSLSIAPQ